MENVIPVKNRKALLLLRKPNSWEKPSTRSGKHRIPAGIKGIATWVSKSSKAKDAPTQIPVHLAHRKVVRPKTFRHRSSCLWQKKAKPNLLFCQETNKTGPALGIHLMLRPYADCLPFSLLNTLPSQSCFATPHAVLICSTLQLSLMLSILDHGARYVDNARCYSFLTCTRADDFCVGSILFFTFQLA